MKLIDLFNTVAKTARPLLAYEILFYCVDQTRIEKPYILKTQIDDALCRDPEKRNSFTKNTSTVISAMEKAGLLKKHSLINDVLSNYEGAPYQVAVTIENEVIKVFSGNN